VGSDSVVCGSDCLEPGPVSWIRSVFSTHGWCRCELPTSSGGRFVLGGFFFVCFCCCP